VLGKGVGPAADLYAAGVMLFEALTGRQLDPVEKALLCQRAEHEGPGMPCGIMDQFSSALGAEGKLLRIDCRSETAELVPMDDPSVAVLVINGIIGVLSAFAVVALVAGPMRRSGAFTVPDFAEYRLGSPRLRKLSGCIVLVIMLLYLVPQFKGAGLVLNLVSGTPYWVGVLLAGMVVSVSIVAGGMRSATYVQAFHYVVKLVFLAVPAVYLVVYARADTRARIPDALTRCVAPLSVISAPETRRAPKVAQGHAKVPPGGVTCL
jgi:hypothetical protein